MKIQSLAVMFIIIILPISLILSTYTQNRVETLRLQAQYDSKLSSATYDALKAYQINSFNSDTSYFANSKMRDVKASVNTFFSSLATNFTTVGYTKETLQSYVPAVVYTMYDGYYIYSPYTNIWDKETIEKHSEDVSYKNGESLYGLKPYVYYSCRYKKSGDYDVIITYSLDNYIAIQGVVNGNQPVSKYGYLLSDVEEKSGEVYYKDILIDEEKILTEIVCVDGSVNNYQYVKRNGIKYYKNINGEVFNVINGKSVKQPNFVFPNEDDSAKQYYKESLEMNKFIIDYLGDLKLSDAVDINGNKFADDSSFTILDNSSDGGRIFDFRHNGGIEAEDSNFNTHRIDVIKYSIERNLSVAISNYNNYSGVSVDFQMPELKPTDWDKIIDNISIISFLQGMSIGGKVYNGYSVVINTKNVDVVTEDSIYIKTSDDVIHRVTEIGLENNINNAIGIYNVDAERRTGENSNGITIYYYPKEGVLSYDSIVTQNNVKNKSDITDPALLRIYYKALGRERYSMNRQKLEIN